MDFFSKLFPKFKAKPTNKDNGQLKVEDDAKWAFSTATFHRESEVDAIENLNLDSDASAVNVDAGGDPGDKKVVETSDNKATRSRSLERFSPETCVRLLRMPSVQNYSGLHRLISESSKEWMKEFLEMNGLEVLFETVDRLSSTNKKQGKMIHTLLVLQCVNCLKAVENSKNALNYIVSQKCYADKLSEVLCSQNPLVKKQLFELMSTLCTFAEDGHTLALDILESYRISHKRRYRFLVLMEEIKQAEVLPYVATLLALVNCIIIGACGFRLRMRIRNEFLVLGLSELMHSFIQLPDEQISLQCSVFGKTQAADEEHAHSLGIKMSASHFALFQAILDKVEDTPDSVSFLILLQNLSLLDSGDTKSHYVWSVLEEISERAIAYSEPVLISLTSKQLLRSVSQSTQTPPTRRVIRKTAVSLDIDRQVKGQKPGDDDAASMISVGSRDSGVSVSRTQSWTSNGSPSPPPINGASQKFTNRPKLTQDKPMSRPQTGTMLADEKKNTDFTKTVKTIPVPRPLPKDKHETEKSNSVECVPKERYTMSESSSNLARTETLNAREKSKADVAPNVKKSMFQSFSMPFWKRSKKYSVNPQIELPEVKIHPPSPDMKQQRSGMTSIELKRFRMKSHCNLTTPYPGERASQSDMELSLTNDFYSSMTSDDLEKETSDLASSFSDDNSSNDSCKTVLSSSDKLTHSLSTQPSPPSPPPPPPPPPPPAIFNSTGVQLRPKHGNVLMLPSKKQNRSSWSSPQINPELDDVSCKPIYNTLPRPKAKMKTLNWAKIPSSRVHAQSIWGEINQEGSLVQPDFEKAERLFCQKEITIGKTEQKARPKLSHQVSLMDGKRSLSIEVYLKQFKGGVDELTQLVSSCRHKTIGAEKLRTLLSLLPEKEEVNVLKSYKGDICDLASAEHFILRMSEVSNCNVRIEGMLLVEEYPCAVRVLHEHIKSLWDTCKQLLTNEGLKSFLKLILVTGNFINTDSYAGNAVGFSLSTLPKLLDTRANRPRMTLLHYLVEESYHKDADSLNFTTALLNSLSRCAKLTLSGIKLELNQMGKDLNRLDDVIRQGDRELKKHFSKFVQNAKHHQVNLEKKVSEIERLSAQLAGWFCEEENKFELEECLSIFYSFCIRIKMAHAENQEFKLAEEKRLTQRKCADETRKK